MSMIIKKEVDSISLTSEMRRKGTKKNIEVLSLLLTLFGKRAAMATEPVSSMLQVTLQARKITHGMERELKRSSV